MGRTYFRVFRDPAKLEELITLRKQGWNLSQLARYFETDHTSIRHHVLKFKLVGKEFNWRNGEINEVPKEQRVLPPTPDSDSWYFNERGERVSRGKSYRQIREEAKTRKQHVHQVTIIYTNWKSQNGYF